MKTEIRKSLRDGFVLNDQEPAGGYRVGAEGGEMTDEKVEIRFTLAQDNRTVKLEMLVADRPVGAIVLDRSAVDYHIGALSRLREGMAG